MKKEKIKILLVGDPYSVFLVQLISHLKKIDTSIQIDVLALSGFSNEVETLANAIIAYKEKGGRSRIWNKVKRYIFWSIQLSKLGKYDIINIHYISSITTIFWKQMKKKAKCTVLSFWGSDFYQSTDSHKSKMNRMLNECDNITFTSNGMLNEVSKYYNDYKEKMSINRFGLDTLELLDKLEEKDMNLFRIKFSIPKDKTIVMCGYSSTPYHRHKDIIHTLTEIDDTILSKCFFIFPMTYGNKKYRNEIISLLSATSFNSLVLDEFLTPMENACLRKTSDILINLPLSDQFSGSMQETLYAENIVLTGSWLPYEELLSQGIYMHSIEAFNNFSEELIFIVKNLNSFKLKTSKNKEIIRTFSHWSNTIDCWRDLYYDCNVNK